MVFNISWQAIGSINLELEQLFDQRENGTIVYFLRGNQLAGVLVWNVVVDLDDVRSLIANPPADGKLVGLLKEK